MKLELIKNWVIAAVAVLCLSFAGTEWVLVTFNATFTIFGLFTNLLMLYVGFLSFDYLWTYEQTKKSRKTN